MKSVTIPPGLEIVSGEKIGRDPRGMSAPELEALGHSSSSVLGAVRAKCLDCCAAQLAEVRKCTATACALWPLRMGTNPLNRRTLTEQQREALRERAGAARAAKATA
ncbi:hypothetical protein [Sphingomonas crocodyli]|uniref:Uncharacterized protein n=1 Tax=Sphingomonas crocodyli TaxID=1979270 RepID=A0A437M750_9SPHN|nr:hypothetical protein [Sphingomonas crocodyli]RVT93423.1 hypothetical protein EOD43_05980 [Sphingomonas crocodyli]